MNDISPNGKDLAQFIRSVRDFCTNLAGLLAAAERAMTDRGWEPAAGNQCRVDASFSLDNGKKWFPYEMFRFFRNDRSRNVLAVVSVVLEGRGEKGTYSPGEPIVSGVWFDYGKSDPGNRQDGWEWWYSRWPTYFPPAPYGTWQMQLVSEYTESDREKHGYKFERVRGLTVPLATITSAEALTAAVIQPLLEDIAKPAD